MPRSTTKKTTPTITTAQKLGSTIKSARDKMRIDKGLNGELDRLPQLTWMMFLKLLDDVEKLREVEAELEGIAYKSTIAYPYRWRDWAANENFTGDRLKNFINNDTAILPNGEEGLGLLSYLRNLQSKTGNKRADVIAKVFKDVTNRMISGATIYDVLNLLNDIHFDKSEEVNILSTLYESMLKEMRDAAGDSGEFYTPRPVVRFIVQAIDLQLGETIFDPACGTGGFLVEAYDRLKQNCTARDWQILQTSILGAEAKSLPLMLAHMNLLLRGFEYPDIDTGNSLRFNLAEMGEKDWVDVILTNPPFGGEEEDSIKKNFPPDRATKETALLFLMLIMRRLRRSSLNPQSPPTPLKKGGVGGGRAAVVFPNGVLFGDGACAKIKEDLLREYNLHTIVRLPNGVFAPYTSIPTNILFFDRSQPTEEIWYYEIPIPEGRKNFTKTKPIQDEDFADCLTWWHDRVENNRAWKYDFRAAYNRAKTEAEVFWEQGEQAKGDAIYWAIYNLDKKNPSSQTDLEHLPPEELVASIMESDRRVAEIMAEIQSLLDKI